jgi:hypothetical protein
VRKEGAARADGERFHRVSTNEFEVVSRNKTRIWMRSRTAFVTSSPLVSSWPYPRRTSRG